MINEETGVLEAPYNLVTLSNTTSNPMLDLGYQCCDMRPYFEYSDGTNFIYTNIHPNNVASQAINIYEKYIKVVDRIEYDAMKYLGISTATNIQNRTVTYNSVEYTYTEVVLNIRGFYVNKWSLIKPISLNKVSDLDRDYVYPGTTQQKLEHGGEFKGTFSENSSGIVYGLKVGTDTWNNLHNCAWAYVGGPTPTADVWFRMTDFEGYKHEAKPSMFGYSPELDNKKIITSSESPFKVTLYRTEDENAVDILKCITSVGSDGSLVEDIKSYYLCALVSEGEVSLLTNNSRTWCRALTHLDSDLVTPIFYEDISGAEVEVKYFKCPQFSEDMIKYLIDSTTGKGSATITLFLADVDSADNLLVDSSFKTDWVYLGMDQLRFSLGVSVPEVAGIELNTSRYGIDFSYAYIDSAIYNADTGAIDCIMKFSDVIEEARTYRVTLKYIQRVYPQEGDILPGMSSYAYYGGNDEAILGVPISFDISSLFRVMSGDQYKITISINGEEGDIIQHISTYESIITIP